MGINLTGKTIASTYEDLVQISGSILTDGLGNDITSLDVTASFVESASWADLAGTAGYASTAGTSGFATSASWADQAGTSGFAISASTADLATTASYATTALSSSYSLTASFAENVVPQDTGSLLVTASISDATITFTKGDTSTFDITVNNVVNADSASVATTASYAELAGTSGYAVNALSASFATTASYAENFDTPTLQEVTDAGNETTTTIESTGFRVTDGIGYREYNNRSITTNLSGIGFVIRGGTGNATVTLSGNDNLPINSIKLDPTTGVELSGSVFSKDSITAPSFTGSLEGTASFATTASFADQAGTSGFAISASQATTASYAENALSSSYAVTASYAENATPTFPYTGSAEISGSLNINGNLYAGDAIGSITAGTFVASVGTTEARVGVGGTPNGSAIAGGHYNLMDAEWGFIGGGSDNQMSSGVQRSAIVGGWDHRLTGGNTSAIVAGGAHNLNASYAAAIAGEANTVSHTNSVIVGGTGLSTSKDSEVVVPNLTAIGDANFTGSLNTTGSLNATGSVQIISDAVITGSLLVSGSDTPLQISGSFSQSLGNVFFDHRTGATYWLYQNQYNGVVRYNSSGGKRSIEVGNGNLNGGVGTVQNSGGQVITNSCTQGGDLTVLMGSGTSTLQGGTSVGVALNGVSQNTSRSVTGCFLAALFQGGGPSSRWVNDGASVYSALIAGRTHRLEFGDSVAILGGSSNFISGSSGAILSGSVIIGGNGNTVGHQNSVIIGGSSFSTTKNNEVVVPNLTISGSAVGQVTTITPASSTGSMDCSVGNFFTMTLDNGTDVRLEASNIQAGQTISLKLTNNATSAGTISFGPEFEFEGGTPFTATAATNAVDVMTFISFDGTTLQATGLKNFS